MVVARGDAGDEMVGDRPVDAGEESARRRGEAGHARRAAEAIEIADAAEPAAELLHGVGQRRDDLAQLLRAAIEGELGLASNRSLAFVGGGLGGRRAGEMTEQQCIRLLCVKERRGAEPGEDGIVRRRDDDHRIEAEIDIGAGISDRLRQAGRRCAGDGGEGAADAGGVKDAVCRLAVDAGFVDEGESAAERCGAADEKLARGARRDFDRQGAG